MLSSTQIQEKYIENDRPGYKLKNSEDLQRIHNIIFESIAGIQKFKKESQERVLLPFLINFMNGFGLETRDSIIPKEFTYLEKQKCAKFSYKMNGKLGWIHVRDANNWD